MGSSETPILEALGSDLAAITQRGAIPTNLLDCKLRFPRGSGTSVTGLTDGRGGAG
jgi:hypothetical protein